MKLYELECREPVFGFTGFIGFVVRADSEDSARAFAYAFSDDGNREKWLDRKKSSCVELSTDGQPGVILGAYED